MAGETWLYDLGPSAGKTTLDPAPGKPVQVGHFEFIFGNSGGYNDALVVDTNTMTVLGIGPEQWLQDARNYPPELGLSLIDIRASLIAHAPDTLSAAGHSGVTGPEGGHQGADTGVVALDLAAPFEPAGQPDHGVDLDALLAGVNPALHPPLDAIHIAIA
jgi:hypothetical protein